MSDPAEEHQPVPAGEQPQQPPPVSAVPTLDYGRPMRSRPQGNDPEGFALGCALALLGLPVLGCAAWVTRDLQTAYVRYPGGLLLAVAVGGGLCWRTVNYAQRDHPDPAAVVRGFLRGVLVAALLLVGSFCLLAGTCFLIMKSG